MIKIRFDYNKPPEPQTLGDICQNAVVEILDGPYKGAIGIFRCHPEGYEDKTCVFIGRTEFGVVADVLSWETSARKVDTWEMTWE